MDVPIVAKPIWTTRLSWLTRLESSSDTVRSEECLGFQTIVIICGYCLHPFHHGCLSSPGDRALQNGALCVSQYLRSFEDFPFGVAFRCEKGRDIVSPKPTADELKLAFVVCPLLKVWDLNSLLCHDRSQFRFVSEITGSRSVEALPCS